MLSLETNFQGPEMCSVISTLSDLKWWWGVILQGNGNWGNSVVHRNPKIPYTLSLTLKRVSCNDSWWWSASTVTKGTVNEAATENKRVTAYWQAWSEHTKGITALGHEAGIPPAISSFRGSHFHILRHFLSHLVNDIKFMLLAVH